MSILITVIIPCHNNEDEIGLAIQSVPDSPEFQIVVINDASTDTSDEVIARELACYKYAKKDIITNSLNRGASGSRNQGLMIAHGKFILFVDSDDRIEGL